MSERMKPTQLLKVVESDAGEVLTTEPDATEQTLDSFRASILRGEQVLSMKPREWVVPGWLPTDSLSAVYAPPGVGKSFYALTLALEQSAGGWWLGTRLDASPVLYVAAERATDLRDRAEAWALRSESKLPDTFELLATPRPPQLTNPTHVEALCRYVEEGGFRLVVLDTYARMTLGLEENSSKDTGPVLESLDRVRQATGGGSVVVVHHSGKDATRGLRGSSAFLGAVDLTVRLDSAGEGTLKATVDKSNAGPEPLPEWFRLEPFGPSAVLTHTGLPPVDAGLEAAVVEILRESTAGSLSMSQLLEALEEQGRKTTRQSLDRQALRVLIARGAVSTTGKARATRYQLTESV